MHRSPLASPARKRRRLSSPSYVNQAGDLTEEEIPALDDFKMRSLETIGLDLGMKELERWKSPQKSDGGSSQGPPSTYPGFGFVQAKNVDPSSDPENPFSSGFSLASKLPATSFRPLTIGFSSASKIAVTNEQERSPSPEAPVEPDFSGWFDSKPMDSLPTFETAKFSTLSASITSFSTASARHIMPSKQAITLAKAQMEIWQNEDEDLIGIPMSQKNIPEMSNSSLQETSLSTVFKPASANHAKSPRRPVLQVVGNVVDSPSSISSGFMRPTASINPRRNPPANVHRPGQFKSPLLRQPHSSNKSPTVSSPLNPNRQTPSLSFVSASNQYSSHPLAVAPITGSDLSTGFTTPCRPKAQSTILKTTPAPFKTPFKPGLGPNGFGKLNTPQSVKGKTPQPPLTKETNWFNAERRPSISRPPKAQKHFFDLTPLPKRLSLASSGLRPQQHDVEELEALGISSYTLCQITADSALYYSFHTTSSSPAPFTSSAPSTILGPDEALQELLRRGCDLATKKWTENHWCLVLWKLAGMVVLEPEKETNPDTTRWCWSEVMRQLLYRYERELNRGIRPPLRKIANQDSPSEFPIVLCVSNVFWLPPGTNEDGIPLEPLPELEVTDGWYRLRARVDEAMARAVRKGVIRVGRKIGVAGAKLSSQKKEPQEIYEAYNSIRLIFSGNSSHLMPWHAKLGFMAGPCISTLHSLTADGGVISALDFVITKLFPVAFLEFFEDEDGTKRREGPRNEVDENKANEQWKKRCEMEASKLKATFDKKYSVLEGYTDRLEKKSTIDPFLPGEDDGPPENIESLYDELEYPDSANIMIGRINPKEAYWLARHIRKQSEATRDRIGQEIEKELQTTCPPRNVRSFRVLIIQDAKTCRRPANRVAQLTVWDVAGLRLDEEDVGSFKEGQRYMVTNVLPQQMSAWMDCEPGSQIFLSTRRDTRWTRIRNSAA